MKRAGILLTIGALIVLAFVVVVPSRAGYETAAYETIEKAGDFELRLYEELRVVATPMSGEGRNQSFGRLFRYISGENSGEQKIEMTTPVFMPGSADGSMREMQFVVPKAVAAAGAPDPKATEVKLDRVPGGRFAALRFSGRMDKATAAEKFSELRDLLKKRGLAPLGDPIYAGYDPPWTPGPMRRNEVLVRVSDAP